MDTLHCKVDISDDKNNEHISELTENELKTSIENILVDGFNVENKQKYESLKKLLDKYNIVSLCSYQEIIDAYKIGERTNKYQFSLSYNKKDNVVYVYPASNAGFSTQCGYIDGGKYYESINIFNVDISSNNFSTLPINSCLDNSVIEDTNITDVNSETEELRQMNEKLRENQQSLLHQVEQNKIQIENLKVEIGAHSCKIDGGEGEHDGENDIENDIQVLQSEELVSIDIEDNTGPRDYKVKSGDNMWNIVKTHYGLTSNRDIANCVNKLVKYNIEHDHAGKLTDDNTPDGIFGDKLYVGQKILLTKELTFRKQKFTLQ